MLPLPSATFPESRPALIQSVLMRAASVKHVRLMARLHKLSKTLLFALFAKSVIAEWIDHRDELAHMIVLGLCLRLE
jgi:hypothetical protein